ncbi:calcineurin B-like protein 7 isoform X2 [Silene latifolia]|uniref:calcineurin B-like protein 7 isoform X2 n=1 Tax=Silene latifolia TaxID=37657 RepID=UPI003D77AA96
MGNCCMKQKREYKETALLAAQTCFSVSDLESLYELYKRLSSSIVDDNFINQEEFAFGLFGSRKKRNLFADRMYHIFDSNHDGLIDFGEFVRSLSIFHPKAPMEDKVSFSFRLYNLGETGYIRLEEVREMVLAFLQESDLVLSDEIVDAIVVKTFEEADSKGDGKIDMEEWTTFVDRNPAVLKNMTLPYLVDIGTRFPSFVERKDEDKEMDIFEASFNKIDDTC